jgi:hypothetical protein
LFCPISKIPHKNSHTKFFVICWFDDVLLILIHGFEVFQVDLTSLIFPTISIHEIRPILTLESSISAPNCVFEPQIRSGNFRAGHPAPGAQNHASFWTEGPGNPALTPDIRPL